MYLSKKIYIGANYDGVTGTINIKKDGKKVKIDFKKVTYVVEQAAYWRKANQIHKWFIDNVQKGEDDCGSYYVEREQLKALCDACRTVLNSKGKKNAVKVANELLPPQSGFFFGDVKIDKYYYQDLQHTLDMLFPLVVVDDETEAADFEYHASW